MQLVVASDGVERELDLVLEDPHATVDDLLDALPDGRGDATGIVVEGRWFDGDVEVADVNLHEGAVLQLASTPPRPRPPRGGPDLVVVAGPDAGRSLALDGRTATVGRDPSCDLRLDDPTVSELHLEFEPGALGHWVVRDLGSSNGTWIDGPAVTKPTTLETEVVIRCGATHLRLRYERVEDRPLGVDPHHRATGGVVPFNRPPRPALPHEPEPSDLPEEPAPSGARRALSVVSIVAPIVLGGVLVWVTGNWRFALFLLMSPVLAVGNWLSSRRQAAKEDTASSRAFRAALRDLDGDLDAAADHERARREVLCPDLAEVARRVRTPSSRLWERRPHHPDFLRLRAGIGDVPWDPPVTVPRDRPPAAVQEVLDRHALLPRAPVEVDLSRGGVVGIVGDRGAAMALARSLVCQAAAHHGPADLGIAILAREDRARDWDWAKWLPHVRDASGSGRWLAGDRGSADALLTALTAGDRDDDRGGGLRSGARGDHRPEGRHVLTVLDDVALTQGRRAPARRLLRGDHHPAAGIVIAETADQLPAVTTTVIELFSELGDAELRRPQAAWGVDELVIGGCTDVTARELARTLARYEDPELELVGAGLPRTVRLLPLLDGDDLGVEEVARAWARDLPDPPPATPLGVGEDGVLHLDLVADGPHGLIGGTTGSGKSELLRSLVAGMAARVDPDHLVFVLVDYKGGSAFDRCAELPHTVGVVTDLDGHLGERALRSLEAELRHRERLLRDAGAQDLPDYLRCGSPAGPLPRLVVVIDEFATLAAELPDLLGALVGIAQRGRSLGVHLLLATQRPSGSVNANIKANTNLRIALRVQDAQDSLDIIDRRDAAELSRDTPGRAYVRLGPGDVELVQTPLSTAASPPERRTTVRLGPFPFAPRLPVIDHADPDAAGPSDLERLVTSVREAFRRTGRPAPRRPWLEMLPERLDLDELAGGGVAGDGGGVPGDDGGDGEGGAGGDGEGGGGVEGAAGTAAVADATAWFGVADDPDHQRRVPVGWTPREGHLGLFGMVGSGTTTALVTLALALTRTHPPDRLHLHALDLGAGGLAGLAGLPHVGAVVPATAGELREKLLRTLRRELDRRRELSPAELAAQPTVVVLVDGIGSLLAEFEGTDGLEEGERFRRVFNDGPTVGIVFAVTGDRLGALPTRYGAAVARKLLFRHADPHEFGAVGIRTTSLPRFVPGRAVDATSELVVQVAHPGGTGDLRAEVAAIAARWEDTPGPPAPRTLPPRVDAGALPVGRVAGGVLELPVGLAEEDLAPVAVRLHPGEHALVAGPPRSGTTSTLALLARQARAADPAAVLVALCSSRSPLYGLEPLDAAGPLADLAGVVRSALTDPRRWVVLVDDAPAVHDVDGVLTALSSSRRPRLHVIGAGRTDDLRGGFAHWTRTLRQARAGVLLQPNLAVDGELLGVRLPRRVPVGLEVPGRGFLVDDGVARLVQLGEDGGVGASATGRRGAGRTVGPQQTT
jgi:DNA segregation ATPase FtsK/SpoIIIE, S-DNA-T family